MNIKKNKKGTYDLTNVTAGKLMAIVSSITMLGNKASTVSQDVKNIIENNSDYKEDTQM
jgi:uncharacterized protein (UPF0335 family)